MKFKLCARTHNTVMNKDGLQMRHSIILKKYVFSSTYARALSDTENPSSNMFYLLMKTMLTFRLTQYDDEPFRHFVIIGGKFHRLSSASQTQRTTTSTSSYHANRSL